MTHTDIMIDPVELCFTCVFETWLHILSPQIQIFSTDWSILKYVLNQAVT